MAITVVPADSGFLYILYVAFLAVDLSTAREIPNGQINTRGMPDAPNHTASEYSRKATLYEEFWLYHTFQS